ncbi:hypothetical protein M758_8G109600 [Ceratodon purpureus]|nr:hypothetical protein M758_8G109600 [Ceratodon purpureus]
MPSLQTMEYLGRLGLVPRKNKKERVASLPHVTESEETRRCSVEVSAGGDRSCKPGLPVDTTSCPLETGTNIKCAIKEPISGTAQDETAHTQQATAFVEIRDTLSTDLSTRADLNFDMADSFFPRTSTSGQEAVIDIEFMEYEQHVQARAKVLADENFGAPGGRHAWKTLIFWKRRRKVPTSTRRTFVSAASTPLYHPPFQALPGRKSYHGSRRSINPATVPLYMSHDEFSSSSIRPWWEPMMRGSGKISMAGGQDSKFCNMSPYVSLGGQPQRVPIAPLYVV